MSDETTPQDSDAMSPASAGSHIELRDYFAAAQLVGRRDDVAAAYQARKCYELADAMLQERGRKIHEAVTAARAKSDDDLPSDVVSRLRQTRADMIGTCDDDHYWDCHEAAAEIERLRTSIRRLADQDATLSVCNGNVTVTMDAAITTEEREAIACAAESYADNDDDEECARIASTLHGLLKRLG